MLFTKTKIDYRFHPFFCEEETYKSLLLRRRWQRCTVREAKLVRIEEIQNNTASHRPPCVYPEAFAERMREENILGKCFRSRTLQNLRQIADFVKSKRLRFEDLQKGLVTPFFVDPAFGAASQFDSASLRSG